MTVLSSLPIVDRNRTEFGQQRTKCGCAACQINCSFIPGYLIPADLQRMIPQKVKPKPWAEENLLASPGAEVARIDRRTGDLDVFRIKTLVLAEKPDHSCIHLGAHGVCQIHDVAPFGCAFFDCRPKREDISRQGLMKVAEAWQKSDSLYRVLWDHLHALGKVSDAPRIKRARMTAWMKENPTWEMPGKMGGAGV